RAKDSANHRARAAVAPIPANAVIAAAVIVMAIAAHCSAECRAGYATGNGARGRIAALIAVIPVTIVAVAAVTVGGITVTIAVGRVTVSIPIGGIAATGRRIAVAAVAAVIARIADRNDRAYARIGVAVIAVAIAVATVTITIAVAGP